MKINKKTFIRILFFKIIIFIIYGCAGAVYIPAVISGVAATTQYSLSKNSYRTKTNPLSEVYKASIESLRKMEFSVVYVKKTEKGRIIKAATHKRKINIILESLSPNTTQVTVNVKKVFLLKDKSTAEEICAQMDLTLEEYNDQESRNQLATLTVMVKPQNASIEIRNIEPKFHQGIELFAVK